MQSRRRSGRVTLSGLTELADDLVADGIHCTGLQIAVRDADGLTEVVRGSSAPELAIDGQTLFFVGCATKPFVAMACALLVDQGLVDLDAPVGASVDRQSRFTTLDASLSDVLNHNAELAWPDLMAVNLCPVHHRRDLFAEAFDHREPGYSEWVGAQLLADVIEHVTGEPAKFFIETRILMQLCIDEEVSLGFTPDELREARDRLGVYVTGLPDRQLPLLHDRSPHQACLDRTALGGYATARALAQFYWSVGQVLDGERVAGLPSPATLTTMMQQASHVPPRKTHGPSGRFAGGFMYGLDKHGLSRSLSPTSFGHTGILGATFGFFDPDARISAAVTLNSLPAHPRDVEPARAGLIDAIVRPA